MLRTQRGSFISLRNAAASPTSKGFSKIHQSFPRTVIGVQEKLGIMNSGQVYAVFDYEAQHSDELTLKNGDSLVVLRKGDDNEREWWWSKLGHKEGYIPRNLLGVSFKLIGRKNISVTFGLIDKFVCYSCIPECSRQKWTEACLKR